MRALLLSVVTLAGCITMPEKAPIFTTKTVEVPVQVKCVISYPKKPSGKITDLPKESKAYAKLSAALQELEGQRQYSKELEAVLMQCAENKAIDATTATQ